MTANTGLREEYRGSDMMLVGYVLVLSAREFGGLMSFFIVINN